MKKNKKSYMWFVKTLFYLYIVIMTYFLFFSEYLHREQTAQDYQINTVLFREIRRYFTHWRTLGLKNFMINIPGNIIAFVPFGFFLPYLNKNYRRLRTVTFLSFFFSQTIEVTQLVTKVGSFDVDDILLNTIGGMLGYLCYKIFDMFNNRRKKKRGKLKGEQDG